MRLLTDTTSDAVGFVGPERPMWTPNLDERDRAIWTALGMPTKPWVAQMDLDIGWQRLVVVADAPRSQLDALQSASGSILEPQGTLACVALNGRGFHGQRGRKWATDRGNLFLTAAFGTHAVASELLASLVMLPAVALVDAIKQTTDLVATIKWVNDVLIGERKVAGVLAATQCKGELVEAAFVGMGANIASVPDVPATVFVPGVTSLQEQGAVITLPSFTRALLLALSRRYRSLLVDPSPLYQAYCDASCVLGREVRIWDESADAFERAEGYPNPMASGVVLHIAPDLSLTLSGVTKPVARGRLALASACGDLESQTKTAQVYENN